MISYEETPSFIQRVTHDLTHRKLYVPDNDILWNDFGIIEPMSTFFRQKELQPQYSEVWGATMEQGRVPQPLLNIKDGSFALRRNKIQELF